MAVLIDTSFIVAYLISSDKNHSRAIELFETFSDRQFGSLYIIDFVLDEVITLLWVRTTRKDVVERAYTFLSDQTGIFKLLMVSPLILEESWKKWIKFAEYPKRPLSFTDSSLLATAEVYSIEYIVTFDDEFDGLISILR